MKSYAESTAFLGQFGLFQRVVFFLLCASIVPNGFGAFTLVFLADAPSHHCLVPDANLTEDWKSAIIPVKVSIMKADIKEAKEKQATQAGITLTLLVFSWKPGMKLTHLFMSF